MPVGSLVDAIAPFRLLTLSAQRILRRQIERRILVEHRLMQVAQRLAGLDPEFFDERAARVLVRRQSFRLAAGAIQREHRQRPQPFAQRVLPHQLFELPRHLRVSTEVQVLLDPVLEAREPGVLEARDVRVGEAPFPELRQRRTAPEGERVRKLPLLAQALEPGQVELVGLDPQQVARLTGHDPLLAEHLAEPGDVHMERLLRGLRRIVLPQAVRQPVGRDDGVGVEEQHRQQRALLRAPEIQEPALRCHFQRAEDPELHVQSVRGARAIPARLPPSPARRSSRPGPVLSAP